MGSKYVKWFCFCRLLDDEITLEVEQNFHIVRVVRSNVFIHPLMTPYFFKYTPV